MRQLLFLWLFCSLSTVHAQTVLTGTVTDKNSGKPLQGVSVSIPSANTGVHTNASGQYRFTIPSKGQYTLQATYLGFKTFTTDISANGSNSGFDIERLC